MFSTNGHHVNTFLIYIATIAATTTTINHT